MLLMVMLSVFYMDVLENVVPKPIHRFLLTLVMIKLWILSLKMPTLPQKPMQILLMKLIHGMFLEWWNTTKSLSTTWQRFSCLLDEGIAKICKKLKSHGGFLSYLQDRTANSAYLAAIFCPALVCPQKAIVGIKFLAYFCSPYVK